MEPTTAATPDALSLWRLDGQRKRLVPPKRWTRGHNVFLFRVWFDSASTVKLDPQAGFVAHRPMDSMPRGKNLMEKVYSHVDDMGRNTGSSPFISTSLSLPWALADAHKMFSTGSTGWVPVKISVIKASALDPATMIVALDHLPPSDDGIPPRPGQLKIRFVGQVMPFPHHKGTRTFANHSQEILILNHIPETAVLGTLHFEADLQNAPELPWTTYDTSLFPENWKKYSAWVYTEFWARTFRKNIRSGDLTLEQHASNCLDLALRFARAAPAPACEICKDTTLALAVYLYLWPFRELRFRSHSPPLPEIETPSHEDGILTLWEYWEMLFEPDGGSDTGHSETSGSQDGLEELYRKLAGATI